MIPLNQHAPRGAALMAILAERERQNELKAAGRFDYTCADDFLSDARKLAVLMEEVGEVAREVLEGDALVHDGGSPVGADARLRAELVQVAAVTLAWIEGLGL